MFKSYFLAFCFHIKYKNKNEGCNRKYPKISFKREHESMSLRFSHVFGIQLLKCWTNINRLSHLLAWQVGFPILTFVCDFLRSHMRVYGFRYTGTVINIVKIQCFVSWMFPNIASKFFPCDALALLEYQIGFCDPFWVREPILSSKILICLFFRGCHAESRIFSQFTRFHVPHSFQTVHARLQSVTVVLQHTVHNRCISNKKNRKK